MLGSCSMVESSNTDWSLSVTGPYESTAIVTGPILRNPNATRPKANTARTIMSDPTPTRETTQETPMSTSITMPIQEAMKLPTKQQNRMLSDGPPSRDDVTTSRTCRDSVEVKIFTSSGMIAPANVPHVMIVDSFHHSEPSAKCGFRRK